MERQSVFYGLSYRNFDQSKQKACTIIKRKTPQIQLGWLQTFAVCFDALTHMLDCALR